MLNLLKTFGKGILYVIGLPFFLVALLLFAVFGILAFLFQVIKSIIFFFTGQKFFPELPEDKELRLLREGPVITNSPETPTVPPTQDAQPIIVPLSEQVEQPEVEVNQEPTIEEACFNQEQEQEIEEEEIEQSPLQNLLDDEPKEEQFEEEKIVEEEPEIDEEETTVLETSDSKVEEEEEVEELDTYFPRSSNYGDQFNDDDDDDDSDGGVNIESV